MATITGKNILKDFENTGKLAMVLTGGPSGIAVTTDEVAVAVQGDEDNGVTGFYFINRSQLFKVLFKPSYIVIAII